MSDIDQILKETGDHALDFIKQSFKAGLFEAKQNSNALIKETGKKIEKWMMMRAKGDLDDEELSELLKARKRVVQQFINSQEIASRARLKKISIELIDTVLDQLMSVVF